MFMILVRAPCTLHYMLFLSRAWLASCDLQYHADWANIFVQEAIVDELMLQPSCHAHEHAASLMFLRCALRSSVLLVFHIELAATRSQIRDSACMHLEVHRITIELQFSSV